MGSHDLLPGDPATVGSWTPTARLGVGATSVVYEAVAADGRVAALKVLRPDLAAEPSFRVRFAREIYALEMLAEAGLVSLLDAQLGLAPHHAVAVVEGATLRRLVEDHGPMTSTAVDVFAADLASSISVVHHCGLVHRDLRPENVVVAPDGRPTLIDFGLAESASPAELTRLGGGLGSPGWMAPEVVRGDEVGPPADVFGWGCLVAYAATGRAPFGEGAGALFATVHADPDLDGMAPGQRAEVLRSLAPEPARRPRAGQLSLVPPFAAVA